jgi:hypothetical protein
MSIPMQPMLRAFMAKMAAHHLEMAKAHDAMCKSDLENASGDFHSRCRDSHLAMGEAVAECMKTVEAEVSKAFAARGSELQPTAVSGINVRPEHVNRAIPRFGQRAIEAPPVDEAFRKIVEVE